MDANVAVHYIFEYLFDEFQLLKYIFYYGALIHILYFITNKFLHHTLGHHTHCIL